MFAEYALFVVGLQPETESVMVSVVCVCACIAGGCTLNWCT